MFFLEISSAIRRQRDWVQVTVTLSTLLHYWEINI